VKNESVAAALDAVMELQAKDEKEKQKQKAKNQTIISSWSCVTCTFINAEGKAQCDMCT